MSFPAPEGTVLVDLIGRGSAFLVGRVRRAGTEGGVEELACKRLLPHLRDVPAARVAMVREAKALALAHHPALPALHEVGADAAGPFLLESVVEGIALRDLKERWGGVIPRHLALHVAREAVVVVRALHALRDEVGPIDLVHGDLGPDNLRLGPHGAIGVLDLGCAHVRGFGPELSTGDRGTAPYVAPEVARGDAASSQASDAYALAATVAWLLLDGEAPLVSARGDAALLAQIGEHGIDPARFAALPGPLRDALGGLLAFDPAGRSADLALLARALAPR